MEKTNKTYTQEEIISLLLDEKIKLYSMKDIQRILNISKSTLDRWIRNSKNDSSLRTSRRGDILSGSSSPSGWSIKVYDFESDDDDQTIMFPLPDLYIGRSPRWTKGTVSAWLIEFNQQK